MKVRGSPTATSSMALVLFDIDGTLVDVRGAGRRAFSRALADAYGVVDELAHVSFAGGTDLDVLDQLRALHGAERVASARHPEFFRAMERALLEELTRDAPHALPGACELVDAVAARATAGLLTGNARACARIKLERAGIPWHFDVGGFGDEHGDRNELARRVLATRGPPRWARVTVIGDTPNDVAAAKAIGARAIAVTTGRYTHTELVACGADEVVAALTDIDSAALVSDV